MNSKASALRNIVLISQVSMSVMVPTFLMLALGLWLDGKFGTWFTVPLLFLGMAGGLRSAYVLVKSVIDREEYQRQKKQEEEINRKVERANAGKQGENYDREVD